MNQITSEIGKLRKELAHYIDMYERAEEEVNSLSYKLAIEEEINDRYRQFFTARPEYCNWMRDHNKQFEAYKESKFYKKISPVAEIKEPE